MASAAAAFIPDHPSMEAMLKQNQKIPFCEEHCATCIYQWCPISNYYLKNGNDTNSDSCACLDCPNFCGFRMHKCKLEEHLNEICPLQVVSCLCSAYGCVLKLPRQKLGQHLIDCPASIIHCTVEWNRWPRLSGEKFPCLNPTDFPPRHYAVPGECINLIRDLGKQEDTYSVFISSESNSCHTKSCNHFSHLVSWNSEFLDEGLLESDLCASQFDLALAARDQNVLESGLRVSKYTRRALRNSITERYPAVPMPSTFTSCPHRCGSEQPCSSCSTNSTNSTLAQDEPEHSYGPPGLSSTVCGRLFRKSTSPVTDDPIRNLPQFTNRPSLYHTDIPQPYVSPLMNDMNQNGSSYYVASNQDEAGLLNFMDESGLLDPALHCSLQLESSTAHSQENRPAMCLNNLNVENPVCSGAGDENHEAVTPLTETMARAVTERSIQVDTMIESYPRYQHKPRAMYTFLCASDVRRREFPDHYKLHCNVISHMDGWIEQRCPLAYLGCPFIMQRLRPNSNECSLVYAPRFSSFSLRYSPLILDKGHKSMAARSMTDSRIQLNDLPNEVLIRIFNFVDNFTMHSLCRTCTRFRSICAYLLPNRGSVSLLWQRRKIANMKQWFCAETVWFFTFGTDSITKWCPVDSSSYSMHEHLTSCEYFERCDNQEPYCLIEEELPFEKLSGANRRRNRSIFK